MFFKKSNINSEVKTSSQRKIIQFLKKTNFLSEEEISMIWGIVSMKEFSVREIMIPRVDVTALPISSNRKELIKKVANSFYSRFPIYDKNIDDIKGVVHIRDIFQKIYSKNDQKDKNWLIKIANEPFFIPESRLILDVLRDLQKAHLQMAIVVDEYGGFSGIVTMEDILEEIIGDVQDESDAEMEEIIIIDSMVYSVDARLDLEEINQKLNIELKDERADTIGGFVVNLFGRIPKKNQSIDSGGIKFTVKTKKGNSVTRIKINLSEIKKKMEK